MRIERLASFGANIAGIGLALSISIAPASAASLYSAAVLADGPVAYYRLGETSGSVAVNSSAAGAALDGAYVNFGVAQTAPATPSSLAAAGPRPGDLSGSATIAGLESDNLGIRSGANANAQVEIPDNDLLDFTGAMTLEAWVRRDDVQAVSTNNEGIIGKFVGSTNQRSYALYYNPRTTAGGPTLGFVINTAGTAAGNVDLVAGVDLPTGTAAGWVHLAAVYEPNVRMTLYLNGQPVAEKTTDLPVGDIFAGTAPLWIGRQFSAASNTSFEGLIDEVALYDKALTDEQVLAHYSAAVPEPSSLALAIYAAAAWGGRRQRPRRLA